MLELVLAMLLLAMLVGMVFSTAQQSLALGNAVVENQNEETLHQSFMELMSRRFSQLPGNTRLDLKYTESGSQVMSDLTLQNVPLGFTWGGQEHIAKAVQLSTVRRADGFLNIVLRYYDNEILEGSTQAANAAPAPLDNTPFAEIVLLEDVNYFEWRVLDGRTMEWQYDWDIQGRLPLQMELKVAFGSQGEELRQIFWITPTQNPEVLMRQLQQQQSNPNIVTPGGGKGPTQGGGGQVILPNGGNGGNGGGNGGNGGGGRGGFGGGGGGGGVGTVPGGGR